MHEKISHDNLPEAISELHQKFDRLLSSLNEKNGTLAAEGDHWFDLTELCTYLPDKPAKATVYGWIHTGLIPHHKKTKKLQFLKSEIDLWIKASRKHTVKEIEAGAENYLAAHKKRK